MNAVSMIRYSAHCALLNLRHWNRLATSQSVTFSIRKPETT